MNREFISSIEEIIEDQRVGKMVIMVDDEDRENEGDLIIPAEKVDDKAVNFMAKYGRGLICLSLTEERVKQLDLPLMSQNNETRDSTAFTVSIEAKEGVTTGISAQDRAITIQAAINKNMTKDDIMSPGHVFPLVARDGGVLVRAGHTEASVDLARLSGNIPAGVICEIMNDDGTMARRDDLLKFGEKFGLKIGTIADLIDYKLSLESTLEKTLKKKVDTEFGKFDLTVWKDLISNEHHFSLSLGNFKDINEPLVRVQTQNVLQDLLGVKEIGKKWSIRSSLKRISQEGAGVFVLINHRDAKSYWLKSLNDEKVEPKKNRRVIGVGSQILRALGLSKIKVLGTNTRYSGLSGFNIEITEFVDE